MTLEDRIALQIGRAAIRVAQLETELEQKNELIAELAARLAEGEPDKAAASE